MIVSKTIDKFMSVDVTKENVEDLTDISTLKFDNSLPKEKRLAYIMKNLDNPFCFRYGNMGIQLEFDDGAPSIEEILTGFLIRKKSGL